MGFQREAEGRQAKEAKEKEMRNAVAAMAPMAPGADLDEYLDVFEDNQSKKNVPKGAWPTNLLSLLNDSDVRTDYNALKNSLLASTSVNGNEVAKTSREYPSGLMWVDSDVRQ